MTTKLIRAALHTLPGGRRGPLGTEMEATLDDVTAAGSLSSTKEAAHVVLLGVNLRSRLASRNGSRPWGAGFSAGATACILARTALAAVRLGTVPSGARSFSSGLAFLPTGPVEATVELAAVLAGLALIARPSRPTRILYALVVAASVLAALHLPTSDRLAAWGFASFGLVGVLIPRSARRPTLRVILSGATGLILLFAGSVLAHGGNAGAGSMIPGQGSSDQLARMLPFAPLILLSLLPLAALDPRPAIAAAVVCVPLAATHLGMLRLAAERSPYPGARIYMPRGTAAFTLTYERGLGLDLGVVVTALLVALLTTTVHRRLAAPSPNSSTGPPEPRPTLQP